MSYPRKLSKSSKPSHDHNVLFLNACTLSTLRTNACRSNVRCRPFANVAKDLIVLQSAQHITSSDPVDHRSHHQ